MSDFDWAQINACHAAYDTCILLCWWHVLHAWQQHFHISDNAELWSLLKKWIRIDNETDFKTVWARIQQIVPAGFTEYLKETWLKDNVVRMWSGVYRTRRDILTFCDTNMLVEA
jgi:hypothetical protein